MPEMENPKTSRSTAKGKLTRIEKYVNDDTIEKNIHDLTIRLNLVENALKDFEKAQCGVESLPGIVLTDEEDERDSFERRYCDVVSKINSLIHKNQNKEQATTTSVRSVSNSNRDDSLNIQLPVYSLPTFSGCYKDWLSFSDQFKSVIHENDKLDSCKKFHYLRSCLKGEALKTVESLSVSNNNYQIAWDLLERRYANERLVAQEHVYAILKFPVIAKASHTHLRELIDMLNTNMEALKMLKVPVDSWDAIIVPIITEKLDFHSKREWQSKVDASIPKYKDFLLFLEKRHQTLESLFLTNKLVVTNVQPSKSKSNSYSSTSNNQSSNKSKFCNACKKPNHYTNQCITLLKLDLNERLKLIQQLKLCQNCFKDNHNAVNFKCKECDASHNTLIHGATGLESSTARPQSVSLNSYSRVNLIKSGILPTAIVLIKDKNNQFQECRAFLDGGSMNHFITSDMCKRLGLTRQKVRIEIGGINQSASSVNHAARVTIKSRHNQYSQELRCLVLDKITENLPVHIMDMSKIAVPENIKLADPRFDCSGPVDLLIGAELFLPLMCIGQIHLAPGQPHFQKTHLGWIVGGTLGELDNKTKTLCHFSQQKLDLHEQVEKFFSIESVNAVADKLSPEERECETHFCNTIKRDAQGRFIARLPFRSNPPDLGDSHAGAVKRFRSLESKLNRHPELKEQYSNFMTEYRQLNHMELLKDPTINFENSCYLPHHAVLKQSSSTTKLRAVFDASFITTNNKCLNDNLLGGPVIQDDLFSILIRFRTHRYVITADIEKMYRQILIDSVDTDYQRILWRDHPNEELKTYRLTTLTYGTKPASFIATRCLVELAVQNQNVNPLASSIIKRDFYMDDLLTGADTISELSTICEDVSTILQGGGFNLRKWTSNVPLTPPKINNCQKNGIVNLDNDVTKTLGLLWDSKNDLLKYDAKPIDQKSRVTKRSVLSIIAQIFDPLGIIGAVITRAKIILQKLWSLKIGWDESVPQDIHCVWINFLKELPYLQMLRIPRGMSELTQITSVELHGFCDASMSAYGATIYVRTFAENNCSVRLLCSKSRVAPLKTITLPRLELCAALLLARLIVSVKKALNIRVTKQYLWSDSMVVLAWLNNSPNTWQTFVANRTAEIQELTAISEWRHVKGKENPADLVSRGLSPRELVDNELWFKGPSWLHSNVADLSPNTPNTAIDHDEIPERRKQTIVAAEVMTIPLPVLTKISSFHKLYRIIAYCLRWLHNHRKSKQRQLGDSGAIKIHELQRAKITIIQLVQNQAFADDLKILRQNKALPNKGRLLTLSPFLSKNNLIRVGGRLRNASLKFDTKHPILLPNDHHVTKLIVEQAHVENLHSGAEGTLAALRQNYWIISPRSLIRQVIHRCNSCFRCNPKRVTQMMGDLPACRLESNRPFLISGVDYLGPILIKESTGRGKRNVKAYVSIFVCLVTKAVHLELVGNLTTESFLGALHRLIARRGHVRHLYSDNGSNFIGAANQETKKFKSFLKSSEFQSDVINKLTERNTEFHFIPARSPHMGGLWEINVKSVKNHIKRSIGLATPTFEEMYTLLTRIEAILNSRPLTPISNDPNDLEPLTPGHFLSPGESLTAVHEGDITEVKTNRLSRWQLVERMRQLFWRRWTREYLSRLQARSKWRNPDTTPAVGSLVLIADDELPPLRWNLARITELHLGKDGLPRVASLKTKNGATKRSVHKLCVLPLEREDVHVLTHYE
jgi:hypothetical protein